MPSFKRKNWGQRRLNREWQKLTGEAEEIAAHNKKVRAGQRPRPIPAPPPAPTKRRAADNRQLRREAAGKYVPGKAHKTEWILLYCSLKNETDKRFALRQLKAQKKRGSLDLAQGKALQSLVL